MKTLVMVLTTDRNAKRVLDAVADDADVFSGPVDEKYFDSPHYAQTMGAKAASGVYLERARKALEAKQNAGAKEIEEAA